MARWTHERIRTHPAARGHCPDDLPSPADLEEDERLWAEKQEARFEATRRRLREDADAES